MQETKIWPGNIGRTNERRLRVFVDLLGHVCFYRWFRFAFGVQFPQQSKNRRSRTQETRIGGGNIGRTNGRCLRVFVDFSGRFRWCVSLLAKSYSNGFWFFASRFWPSQSVFFFMSVCLSVCLSVYLFVVLGYSCLSFGKMF